METIQIIISILGLLGAVIGGIIGWAFKVQQKIADLKLQVAVNTSKDEQLNKHVLKMEDKLDELMSAIGGIKEALATLAAQNNN